MKYAYPIVIKKCSEYNIVYVPDFDVDTQGRDIPDSIAMARDVIAMTGCRWEDEGKELPLSSDLSAVTCNDGDIVTLVDVDFGEYRRKNDKRSIRKSVTIPMWLSVEAEKHHINVSRTLAEALAERVGKRI